MRGGAIEGCRGKEKEREDKKDGGEERKKEVERNGRKGR